MAKIFKGRQNWVWCSFAKSAQTTLLHFPGQIFKLFQVTFFPGSGADSLQQIEHTAGANPAECTFTAGLVLSEAQKITGNIDHTIILI